MARVGTPAGRLTPAGSDAAPRRAAPYAARARSSVATATVASRNAAAISHSRAEPRRARTGVASMAASVVSDRTSAGRRRHRRRDAGTSGSAVTVAREILRRRGTPVELSGISIATIGPGSGRCQGQRPSPSLSRYDRGSMDSVTLTIDGTSGHGRQGQDRAAGGHRARVLRPLLLLSPRSRHRRVLPRLHRQDREDGEAADRVLDRLHRGHGRVDRVARRGPGASRRVRVPAGQPPARLPGVRQGRRVPAAGLLVLVRARRQPDGVPAPDVRRRGREGRRRLRADADAEPQPVHPVHPVRALHAGGRHRRADRHRRARQRQPDCDLRGAGRALAAFGQPDGRLPGGRDHDAGLPLQVAAVGQPRRRRTPSARCARRAAARRRGSRPSPSGPRAHGWCGSRRATSRRSTATGCATSAGSTTTGSKATSVCRVRWCAKGPGTSRRRRGTRRCGRWASARRRSPARASPSWCRRTPPTKRSS